MAYVISENTTQRTLRPSQVALAIGKMRPFQERMAKERQGGSGRFGGSGSIGPEPETLGSIGPKVEDQGRVNTILAKKAGVSPAMMKREAHNWNSACDPDSWLSEKTMSQKSCGRIWRAGP